MNKVRYYYEFDRLHRRFVLVEREFASAACGCSAEAQKLRRRLIAVRMGLAALAYLATVLASAMSVTRIFGS